MTTDVKVLVIDDEPGIRELLSRELISLGYDAITAANGQEAIESVRRQKIRLALCDINLPGMNGFQVLETLQKERFSGYGDWTTAASLPALNTPHSARWPLSPGNGGQSNKPL